MSLSHQTFTDSFAADNTPEDMAYFLEHQFNAAQLEEQLSLPLNYFFITWDAGEPLAYMRLVEHPDGHPDYYPGIRSLEIVRFYAVQKAIGKGIAPLQMDFALSFARDRGIEHVWLGVWEKNYRAIRFYEKHGFTAVGTHSFLLGHDLQTDLIMGRIL